MPHNHQHSGPANVNRAFAIGIALNLGFVGIEVFYGIVSGSLALIADAGHNLTDVFSLIIAWVASYLAKRKPTERLTYGLRRATILSPLFSAILLLMAMGAMAWEALVRLAEPAVVQGGTMIIVALVGVIINAATAMLFMKGQKRDLNIKGAYIHMLADAAVSIGVVLAGIAIMLTGKVWLDPVISLVIVLIIIHGTWSLLTDSLQLAVDAVPENINPTEVRNYLLSLPGVTSLHDLHIWGMSTTESALTAHLVVTDKKTDDDFLRRITRELHQNYGIGHSTIQVENGNCRSQCEKA